MVPIGVGLLLQIVGLFSIAYLGYYGYSVYELLQFFIIAYLLYLFQHCFAIHCCRFAGGIIIFNFFVRKRAISIVMSLGLCNFKNFFSGLCSHLIAQLLETRKAGPYKIFQIKNPKHKKNQAICYFSLYINRPIYFCCHNRRPTTSIQQTSEKYSFYKHKHKYAIDQ